MNSIESYTPPKFLVTDEEDTGLLDKLLTSDPAALEALRALMGSPMAGLPTLGTAFLVPDDKKKLSPELTAELTALLQSVAGQTAPGSALAPLVNSLRESLTKTAGDLTQDPAADELLKSLLLALKAEPVQNPLTAAPNAISPTEALRKALEDAFTSTSTAATTSTATAPAVQETSEPPTPAEVSTLGNSILQSIGSHSSTTAATAAQQTHGASAADRIEQVSVLMNQMADRVLVTDPLHGQNSEVRVKLTNDIMPGTEVRVWREDGGQLRVSFDTTDAYWARVLSESSSQLTQRLNQNLNLPEGALVTVQHESGQPEDGRSRNRYTPWEMAQQAEDEA